MHTIDMHNPDEVSRTLLQGAQAMLDASCRDGSIDRIEAPGKLIATGDTHDNPVNFGAVVEAAGLSGEFGAEEHHLTLHEIIHPDTLDEHGEDTSFEGLTRVAWLKTEYPELVHVLLANHELAQAMNQLIVKNGSRCVEAFDAGLDRRFGDDAQQVRDAVRAFVFAMPIALRCHCPQGDILCAHSLPAPAIMSRFDTSILSRPLTEEDYESRTGSAHMMTWGRGYDADQLEDLVESWGVNLFILGHEHADNGYSIVEPNAIVLNTDHDRGVYLPIDLEHEPTVMQCAQRVVPIRSARAW